MHRITCTLYYKSYDIVLCMYILCMLRTCCVHVACMLCTCHMHVVCMFIHVWYRHVVVCLYNMHLINMYSCNMHVTCMQNVPNPCMLHACICLCNLQETCAPSTACFCLVYACNMHVTCALFRIGLRHACSNLSQTMIM
jgi:hypothetical protein